MLRYKLIIVKDNWHLFEIYTFIYLNDILDL